MYVKSPAVGYLVLTQRREKVSLKSGVILPEPLTLATALGPQAAHVRLIFLLDDERVNEVRSVAVCRRQLSRANVGQPERAEEGDSARHGGQEQEEVSGNESTTCHRVNRRTARIKRVLLSQISDSAATRNLQTTHRHAARNYRAHQHSNNYKKPALKECNDPRPHCFCNSWPWSSTFWLQHRRTSSTHRVTFVRQVWWS